MKRNFISITSVLRHIFCFITISVACNEVFSANPFRDVPIDHFSYQAIDQLVQNGVMQGYPDGTFKGRKVITRYEFAVMIAKLLAKIDAA
ncbi:S-layer homology domain-containing protein, partial [bacterium]|nr:S-layer homology domain-containing protein [bacterium]